MDISKEQFKDALLEELDFGTLGENVTIGESAFENTDLQNIIITTNIKCIKKDAFKNCKKLVVVYIMDNSIGYLEDMFSGCNISNMKIPVSIKKISKSFFKDNSIINIRYGGTSDEWKRLTRDIPKEHLGHAIVHTSDHKVSTQITYGGY